MARYITTVRTAMPADEAFAYMADLENFAEWDPGVSSSTQVKGDGPGLDAAYDVRASGADLRYETLEYDEPSRIVVQAQTTFFRSYDIIEVSPNDDGGCDVTYDATLELSGIFGIADIGLRLFFDNIGAKATTGLVKVLDGTKIR